MDSCLLMCVLVLVLIQVFLQASEGIEYVNVALEKPTYQTNTFSGGFSWKAVDGNRNPDFGSGTCTHTHKPGENNWWMVDLLRSYPIHHVAITNRLKHHDYLYNFKIYVSTINPLPIPTLDGSLTGKVCVTHHGALASNGPHTLPCTREMRGRFVYVFLPEQSANQLTLCEVEVMVPRYGLLPQRQETFSITPGKKSDTPPFYSVPIGIQSSIKCISVCLSATGGDVTVAQMEESTRTCHCIQDDGLDSFEPIRVASGWVLMERNDKGTITRK